MNDRRSLTRFMPAAVLLGACVLLCSRAGAQPSVDRFFPPVATIGEETQIKAEGKFPSWPVQAWSDREDIVVQAGSEQGELTLRASADAAPGVAWIRLFDSAGAASLRPVLVDKTPATSETEPNNERDEALAATLPLRVVGKLEKRGDVDCVAVELEAGTRLTVAVTANRDLGSPMDAIVQITDDAGYVLAQSDDEAGLDPRLQFSPAHGGRYIIRLFAFPETPTSAIGFAGGADFLYQLTATAGPCLDYVLPLASADAPNPGRVAVGSSLQGDEQVHVARSSATDRATAYAAGAEGWITLPAEPAHQVVSIAGASQPPSPIEHLPASVSGRFTSPDQVDRVPLVLKKGVKYRATASARGLGLSSDPKLRLVAAEGKQIAAKDDRSRSDFDVTLDFAAPDDGTYTLEIADAVSGFGPRHAYEVRITEVRSDFGLAVATDAFVLKGGGELEIPVQIDRRDGFAGPITVAIEGLPEGVSCAPLASEPKGDTAKEVKLKISGSTPGGFSGPITIVGQGEQDAESLRHTARAKLAGGATTDRVWLTVVAEGRET